ncbi:hypothetical protein EG328_007520 [Venturia inaequalis]|uniref:XPG-I domain-containing protein n=1 Tax=Venturia inaequalis TaxID=5025 RepID=A0A8H3YQQ7_VENIN|nr:hypothetical protein EG328_007520 [Venturia inaequalis]KAE9991410.1 hypothetical protein EG327_011713 [Venturia inaequalis]
MINQFEEWSAHHGLAEQSPMDALKDSIVGIEATEYLNRLNKMPYPDLTRPVQEALLPALGGVPFGLKHIIKHHISTWRKHGITPLFVFDGLHMRGEDSAFHNSDENTNVSSLAWEQYAGGDAAGTVQTFGDSNLVTAKDLYRFLQTILQELNVEFMVAPYRAWAQLAYLQKHNVVDTVYGASEIFLFDVPEVITRWDFMEDQVVWIRRRECLRMLHNLQSDSFTDACLLAGNDLLEPCPLLSKQPNVFAVKEAASLMSANSPSGPPRGDNVCQTLLSNHPSKYQDKFRKARLAVKHHVVLTVDGKVELLNAREAPDALTDVVIGQRLPDELYYYLSKGLISARVLSWLTQTEVLEPPPLDGGFSDAYRNLVSEQLNEMRTSTIGLLAFSLVRSYAKTPLRMRCWFDKGKIQTIDFRNADDPRPALEKWNVREDVFSAELRKLEGCGTIGACIRLISGEGFAAKTVTPKTAGKPLRTKDEILLNATWQLLQFRGYIDENHKLTTWGQVLHSVITATSSEGIMPGKDLEEGALIAVELARYGLLNTNTMFASYGGAPHLGTGKDKRCTLLISRIANFGRFDHQAIGYTGPLSRNMLAYNSLVTAVRTGLRDMSEACVTAMLLDGQVSRKSCDLTELGLDLPFLINNDCVLSVVALSHFGEMSTLEQPISYETVNERVKYENDVLFKYAEDYPKQIRKILVLWDAIYKGVTVMPDTFKHKSQFHEVNEWLQPLR